MRSGLAQPIDINVGGQVPLSQLITFDYDAPVVDRLRGCTLNADLTTISECPPKGGDTITLIGRSFGAAISLATATPRNPNPLLVFVDGKPCTSLTMTTQHTTVCNCVLVALLLMPCVCASQLTCKTPASAGKNRTITITRGAAQQYSRNMLSYAGPVFFPNTLRKQGQVSGFGRVTATSMLGGDILKFSGRYLNTITGNLNNIVINYGPPEKVTA